MILWWCDVNDYIFPNDQMVIQSPTYMCDPVRASMLFFMGSHSDTWGLYAGTIIVILGHMGAINIAQLYKK